MNTILSLPFSGGLPARGDVAPAYWAVSLVNQQAIRLSTGQTIALPEVANDVRVSAGGQYAWIGQDSGLIYLGTQSTGVKGYGEHSFLFVGETLKTFADVATYQATAGGWAYVDEHGAIVPFGEYYSNPPLANAVKFSDIWIGQGPNDGDGLCGYVLGEAAPRQILAGNANDIRVARTGDTFRILTVSYSGHLTTILEATLAELRAMPMLTPPSPPPSPAPVPPPTPSPEPTPVTYDANTPSTWTDDQLRAWIGQQLTAARSTDDPTYWFGVMRQHSLFADAAYWAGRIATGDGAGKAGPAPTPTPSPTPAPSPDLSALLASVAALTSRVSALEQKPAPDVDLSAYAKHGAPVSVTGHVAFSFFGSTFTSKDATWTGKVE